MITYILQINHCAWRTHWARGQPHLPAHLVGYPGQGGPPKTPLMKVPSPTYFLVSTVDLLRAQLPWHVGAHIRLLRDPPLLLEPLPRSPMFNSRMRGSGPSLTPDLRDGPASVRRQQGLSPVSPALGWPTCCSVGPLWGLQHVLSTRLKRASCAMGGCQA